MNRNLKIFLFMCVIGIIIGIIVYWLLARREREVFISSKKWIGKKQGYVFTRGDKGQGYYKDKLNK
jgi:hypothetical protein